MADFFVTNLSDTGAGSLRAAIAGVNAEAPGSENAISFSVAGTITLASDLPAIASMVAIVAGDSTTGSAPTIGIDFNGNGGLVFAAGADGSQLMGLALGNATGNGVTLEAGGILLNNNYIGLALDGTAAGNTGDGVFVAASSSGNQIGFNPEAATLAADGQPASGVVSNVISANGGNGITLEGSDDNTIVSNRIGTSTDGNTALANGGNGIHLRSGADGNTIGGTVTGNDASGNPNNPTGNEGDASAIVVVAPPLGNLVSGNAGDGIRIDSNSTGNTLSGNYVGTATSGISALGNQGDGVAIVDSDSNTLVGCLVTDNPFVYYNVVAGNTGNGIRVTDSDNVTIRANFVGLGADNATVVANAVDGILINGNSQNTTVGGVIPLGNVVAGNGNNGIEVADTASGFSTLNTFTGITAFFGIAPNGNNGMLITSTGGGQIIQTNVISGNLGNGLEISGDASGVTVVPNVIGLNTRGDGALPNAGNGILIAGTAHDNVIGGTGIVSSDSVVRQNTISGNGLYGVVIAGAAYNNTLADSAIGTDIQELAALPNGAGGVLLSSTGIGNVIGTAIVGFSPLPSPAAHVNVVSGNTGNGVTIDSGVNFNAVLNNWIGLDVFGQAVLPNTGPNIVNNGGTNLVYGNFATGPLPVESPTGQLEALYIGWFGRAADAPGFESDMATFLGEIQGGASIATAALVVSQRFATSPESAPYAALLTLVPPPIDDPTPQQRALLDSFVNKTFTNLFGRSAEVSELTLWADAYFQGAVPFADMVYDIASAAQGDDIAVMNAKVQAGSYFSEAAASFHVPPSLSEMQAAVSGVTDITTGLVSVAATNALAGSTHTQIDYQSILSPLDIITGVRADLHGSVILTGSQGTLGSVDTRAFLFQGPLNNTAAGTVHLLDPVFAGQDITTSTFYGPDTSIFTPDIGLGNVSAVGSYQYEQSPAGVVNHGMIYQGPIDGTGGTWTQVDVPSNGVNVTGGVVIGTTVADTILHSTMGGLVVGNYDVDPSGEAGANGFIYNVATGQYTLLSINGSTDNLTSVYGIWQNGVGNSSYTLAGGTRDGNGLNVAFLQNYDSLSGVFSDLTFFTSGNRPSVVTHFENITAVPGGFNLVATTDSGPAFASVTVNPDGSFGEAVWADIDLPGSNLLTGNIVYQNIIGGIYNTDGDAAALSSYLGVVDQTHVSASGGLIMPVGSHDFAYSLSVGASTGAIIVGSTAAGNVLGGSIGNDTITGNQGMALADTIFTGGGADTIILSAGGTVQDRVELFAANGSANAMALSPGAPVQSVVGSIVDASNIPQLGWWGQATAQLGGPVSNAATNAGFGTGTSLDMSTVANFTTGTSAAPVDTVDIALNAFSGLLRGLGADTSPDPGSAVFSNLVAPGGTVTVADANVLLIDSPLGFANAASVAAALAANPITFAAAQTAEFNHYIVAYQDLGGDVRIADMNIASGGTPFTTTAGGTTLAISDMAELQGVSLAALQPANITFLTGAEIANSTYLDFTGYRITDETTVEAAYGLDPGEVRAFNGATDGGINVAIILERANDPSALLDSNWATRQQSLGDLGTDGVFDLYGANETLFNNVVAELQGAPYGLTVLDSSNSNYVTSAQSRTIWVAIESQQDFLNLFQTPLEYSTEQEFVFWNGLLSLPTQWNVSGLWFDTDNAPGPSDLGGTPGSLPPGAQSAGNSTTNPNVLAPQDIAALYNFPLVGQTAATGLIGLIEPGYGSSLSDDPTGAAFQQRLVDYLDRIGQVGAGDYYVQGIDGQSGSSLERSLDVGVVSAINPNSLIGLYNGSGNLSSPNGATIVRGAATGAITNDDVALPPEPPALSISDVSVIEGNPGTGSGTGPAAAGWLSTSGNQIVDVEGHSVQIAGVNWFGFESSTLAPHGLWARGYKDMIDQMSDLGFNTIRLPFSSETLHTTAMPNGIDFAKNPDLQGLSAIQVMDKIVDYAGHAGLKIILDHHRSDSGPGTSSNGLWYDAQHSEEQWISDWQMLATRYADNPTVIGADLHNEPYSGTWGGGGPNDWAAAAERAGDAIGTVNPNWLIFVEGVGTYQGQNYWWGGNLMGVKDRPIDLAVDNKLVYSPHDYPHSVYAQPWFEGDNFAAGLPAKFDQMWGYIYREGIAPVYIGEFGTNLTDPKDAPWLEAITSYISGDLDNNGSHDLSAGKQGVSWTFWSWNPNSGDTGGILGNDWSTVNQAKMAYLTPVQFDFSNGTRGAGNEAVFVLTLSKPATETVTVDYHTVAGDAGAEDFAGGSGSVTFGAGEQSKTISIPITADKLVEGNEHFSVVLTNAVGASTAATGNATASVFTAVQSAIWDTTNNPAVTSNSWSDSQSLAPYSPFYAAYHELFTDAALRNQSTFIALGDGGSGNQTGNGLTNVTYSSTSPYNILVGGTSLSTAAVAANDYTLDATVASAMAGDRETIWQLVIGGLRTLPTTAAAAEFFVESVWNYYYADGSLITGTQYENNGYLQNSAGSGGVDPTQPVPWYQQAYGLDPTTADLAPWRQSGRGVPDVAANAGGNLLYDVPGPNMLDPSDDYGTSAAAPLWASLGVQLNTIFADHGLPQQLGYMNDLLYIASAIAPASFNDVTIGNNTSSFLFATPGSYTTNDGNGTPFGVDPTNVGYYAGPGYDLTTGLGTPNGLLLARALTTIAHAQVSYSDSPDMLDSNGSGSWTSGVGQTLLFQTMSGYGASIALDLGASVINYQSGASGLYAWTNQLAQQSLQSDFDPALVRLFDKYGQGAVAQSFVASGDSVAVQIDGASADAIQGTLSSAFGFADFLTSNGALRVARPVAVAETAGGLDDQTAVVRVRQNGEDSNTLTFYKVDDYAGTINGLQPGQAGYIEAAQATTYQFAAGGTVLAGAGYGNYSQGTLVGVDSGDLIAMAMVNQTSGNLYWGFAQANGDGVGHLWNYGLNTWGWEDLYGGGDHDYNDMIVQLDFTSTAGQGLLV